MTEVCHEKDCQKCLARFNEMMFWYCPYGKKRDPRMSEEPVQPISWKVKLEERARKLADELLAKKEVA